MTLRRVESAAVAVAGVVAVGTLGYRLGAGVPAAAAFTAALAVLLVAAPAALRLATATPLLVAAARGARLGILLTDAPAAARRVDTVVLAGTDLLLTSGLELHDVRTVDGVASDDVLRLAGAVAQESERPVDRAVAAASARLPDVAEFDMVGDLGARGIVAEVVTGADDEQRVIAHAVLVGSVALLTAHDIALPAELASVPDDAVAMGRIPVAVAWDGAARAVLAVGHTVAPSGMAAVRRLRELGLRTVLLTAEAGPAARAAAMRAGIDPEAVVAGVEPPDGDAVVQRLRAGGARVAVVADGGHAAALAAADLGVRVELAARSSDDKGADPHAWFTLVRGDLPAAVDAIRLARSATTVARANVALAVVCLTAGLPAAAAGVLDPVLAGAAAAAAATVVVANSLRLQRFGPTGG